MQQILVFVSPQNIDNGHSSHHDIASSSSCKLQASLRVTSRTYHLMASGGCDPTITSARVTVWKYQEWMYSYPWLINRKNDDHTSSTPASVSSTAIASTLYISNPVPSDPMGHDGTTLWQRFRNISPPRIPTLPSNQEVMGISHSASLLFLFAESALMRSWKASCRQPSGPRHPPYTLRNGVLPGYLSQTVNESST